MAQTKQEQIELLDKMVRRTMEYKQSIHSMVISTMCIVADDEEMDKLKKGLALIESAMQHTASHHSARRRKLIRNKE